MRQQDGFWKQFESTGQIQDYLHYKKGPEAENKENRNADDYQRTGSAGDKDQLGGSRALYFDTGARNHLSNGQRSFAAEKQVVQRHGAFLLFRVYALPGEEYVHCG